VCLLFDISSPFLGCSKIVNLEFERVFAKIRQKSILPNEAEATSFEQIVAVVNPK